MDEKKIHSIIDEAMAARDRSVSIYISPDGGHSETFLDESGMEAVAIVMVFSCVELVQPIADFLMSQNFFVHCAPP